MKYVPSTQTRERARGGGTVKQRPEKPGERPCFECAIFFYLVEKKRERDSAPVFEVFVLTVRGPRKKEAWFGFVGIHLGTEERTVQ